MTVSSNLNSVRIAILATDGFEQSELMVPLKQLRAAGATVDVIAPQGGMIKGWLEKNWGESVDVNVELSAANASDYAALVLPGGQMNPDILRLNPAAIDFIKQFSEAAKPIAAICHAPWLLIEAGLVKGLKLTSYGSIKTDLINAGAVWLDQEVVVDQGIITSRSPKDLAAFCAKIAEVTLERQQPRRKIA